MTTHCRCPHCQCRRIGYRDWQGACPACRIGDHRLTRGLIVCICGSTRFAAHMNAEAERLTLDGIIVVRPEVITYNRDNDPQHVAPEIKAALDELHLRKIDLADKIHVVTEYGYVGDSTKREIAYARQTGKPVEFIEYGK